ncbi:D-serine ammonia-lyase [Cytobacillus solani]|uniref:Probable D-serine dehydratase n=1 Tax=Cytobacillus solani TaxID=1637975 RepID=A0A0Q3VEJ0_9BACI|nr:D-serine ammonia-lyase [Cytobacillus solani]KOP79631.1 serine ammonia-lyase [Bacillus sp. FJAT-21945]KQL17575.1 serine ammonia-lyase [Cytobacillus solani]USK55436.1 D-serine ammonia-lyase [Cytobacillus solani]
MSEKVILGRTLVEWKKRLPLLNEVIDLKEVFWTNPMYQTASEPSSLSFKNIMDAEERLARFAPYIAKVFPETENSSGLIESPLISVPQMKRGLEQIYHFELPGRLLLKCDSHLPISGSIKARGGIYEVLKYAEDLALKHQMISLKDDYSVFADQTFKDFFSRYSIAVGSTGNLGLSIGIMSAKLGFNVYVHMSADAKRWKKDLLRAKGVNVVEHNSDFSEAVAQGRKQAAGDPHMYFIDDESSRHLFLGYSVAAIRLKKQLEDMNIQVNEENPLVVYLPCGVGGGPGGITFGLKQVFKEHVHCFFAEPTHSPCMLLGLMTGLHDQVSVQDFGLDNQTEADGLAVGRPSGFVGKFLEKEISGIYTVEDEKLFTLLTILADTEGIYLEPSALAGFLGPVQLLKSQMGGNNKLDVSLKKATHIIWGTGGSMVPKAEMKKYYERGI